MDGLLSTRRLLVVSISCCLSFIVLWKLARILRIGSDDVLELLFPRLLVGFGPGAGEGYFVLVIQRNGYLRRVSSSLNTLDFAVIIPCAPSSVARVVGIVDSRTQPRNRCCRFSKQENVALDMIPCIGWGRQNVAAIQLVLFFGQRTERCKTVISGDRCCHEISLSLIHI